MLDALVARGIPTTVLVRQTSSKRFIEAQLSRVNVRLGTILDRASLRQATADATHVIHCAGCVKALRPAEFYEVNRSGRAMLSRPSTTRTRGLGARPYLQSGCCRASDSRGARP